MFCGREPRVLPVTPEAMSAAKINAPQDYWSQLAVLKYDNGAPTAISSECMLRCVRRRGVITVDPKKTAGVVLIIARRWRRCRLYYLCLSSGSMKLCATCLTIIKRWWDCRATQQQPGRRCSQTVSGVLIKLDGELMWATIPGSYPTKIV